jgi:hypothetical protein
LLKWIEDSRENVRSDSNSTVNNLQPKPAALRIARTQLEPTIRRGELNGILDEIPEDLLQTSTVCSNAVFDRFELKLDSQVFSRDFVRTDSKGGMQ